MKLRLKVADSKVAIRAVGMRMNAMVQDAPAARVPPENELHVVEEVKSEEFAPVIVPLENVIGLDRPLVRLATSEALVEFCVTAPKAMLLGDSVT